MSHCNREEGEMSHSDREEGEMSHYNRERRVRCPTVIGRGG